MQAENMEAHLVCSECGISTTTLSVAEFADYTREVENYAQIELGLEIV